MVDNPTSSNPTDEKKARPGMAARKAAKAAATGASGEGADQAAAAPSLRKKDLLDRVVKATGGKAANVKSIIDATLTVIAASLAAGEDLNLAPLGKIKINRQKDLPKGGVYMLKLRHGLGTDTAAGGKGKGKGKGKSAPAEDDLAADAE